MRIRAGLDQKGVVRIEKSTSQECLAVEVRVIKECSEVLFVEVLEDVQEKISVNYRQLNNLRYADEMVSIADSASELQTLIDRAEQVCDSFNV